jgi:hypothetical protein
MIPIPGTDPGYIFEWLYTLFSPVGISHTHPVPYPREHSDLPFICRFISSLSLLERKESAGSLLHRLY